MQWRIEIQGQNFKYLLAIMEEILEHSREKSCSFKASVVFVGSSGSPATIQKSQMFCLEV